MSLSRRKILKGSLALAGASLFESCASIDRFFLGDKRVLDNEVLIVGGGISGLVAALQLKKARVPYRVVEASARFGGRIHTIDSFDNIKTPIELGADYFVDGDIETLALMKELRLNKIESSWRASKSNYLFENKFVTSKDLLKQIQPMNTHLSQLRQKLMAKIKADAKAIDKALEKEKLEGKAESKFDAKNEMKAEEFTALDQNSALNFLSHTSVSISLLGLSFVEDAAQQEFGAALSEVSALQLILRWDRIQALLIPGLQHFTIEGGNQVLIHRLLERVTGVIPDYLVRSQYKLVKVIDRGFIFECHFQTPQGEELLFAKNIIFAVPEVALLQVTGFMDLQISPARKAFLAKQRRGAHTKVLVSGEGTSELPDHFLSSKGQGRWIRGLQLAKENPAFVSAQKLRLETLIDEEARSSDQSRVQEFTHDLTKWGSLERKANFSDESLLINWAQKEERGVSKSYLAPGDFSANSVNLKNQDLEGRIAFAGEAESLYYAGTVEGAIRSGLAAAKLFTI